MRSWFYSSTSNLRFPCCAEFRKLSHGQHVRATGAAAKALSASSSDCGGSTSAFEKHKHHDTYEVWQALAHVQLMPLAQAWPSCPGEPYELEH